MLTFDCSHSSLVNTTAAITMEDDLMFSMEEEEGSGRRAPAQRCVPSQRLSSLSESNASDDDDEDNFICPILDDSAREICHYLKNLVYTRQSGSLPKNNFAFKVRCCPGNGMLPEMVPSREDRDEDQLMCSSGMRTVSLCCGRALSSHCCLIRRADRCVSAHT